MNDEGSDKFISIKRLENKDFCKFSSENFKILKDLNIENLGFWIFEIFKPCKFLKSFEYLKVLISY